MTPKGFILLLGATWVALAPAAWGQRSSAWPVNLRGYRAIDGLAESACIAVTLAPHEKVLARHLKLAALTQLDGYGVTVIPTSDVGASRVYESSGGQLWTVVATGLQEYQNGSWVLHPVPDIAAPSEIP